MLEHTKAASADISDSPVNPVTKTNKGKASGENVDIKNIAVKLNLKQRLDYAIGDFGYNFIYVWISSMMVIFLTDQMGIAAAAVSALTLLVRIFDAFNDPLIGSIADRCTDKGKGKYKPWVRWGGLAMSLAILALFAMQPGWSMTVKLVYMWVVYIMITVLSTCCNMPYGALNGVLTADTGERNKLSGLRMVFSNGGSAVTGLIAVPLIVLFSGAGDGVTQNGRGYFFAVLVCIILGLPTLFWSSYKVEEVVKPPKTQTKIPLGLQFKAFFGNKYAVLVMLSFFMIGFCVYGKMAIMIYYLTYLVGNAGLYSFVNLLGLVGAVLGAGFLGSWVFSKLRHKGWTLALCYGFGGVFAGLGYFLTPGGTAWMVSYTISQITYCAGIGVAYGMVGDATDMGEYISGVRVDGFIASFVSLMMKAGGAAGPAILVAWMGSAGYIANAVQNENVLNIMNIGVNLIPCICCLCIVVFGLCFNLPQKKHEEILAELARRRI